MSERISYADADGNPGAEPIPMLDRIFGSALVLFGGLITLVLAPIIIGIGSPGLAIFQHNLGVATVGRNDCQFSKSRKLDGLSFDDSVFLYEIGDFSVDIYSGSLDPAALSI